MKKVSFKLRANVLGAFKLTHKGEAQTSEEESDGGKVYHVTSGFIQRKRGITVL